jgi:hypothetical protein
MNAGAIGALVSVGLVVLLFLAIKIWGFAAVAIVVGILAVAGIVVVYLATR